MKKLREINNQWASKTLIREETHDLKVLKIDCWLGLVHTWYVCFIPKKFTQIILICWLGLSFFQNKKLIRVIMKTTPKTSNNN